MSASGSWNVTVKSPMGEGPATMTFVEEGGSLSGTINGAQGEQSFEGGTAEGNALSWVIDVTSPMPMKVECSAAIDGDVISGTLKFGAMGQAAFEGARSS